MPVHWVVASVLIPFASVTFTPVIVIEGIAIGASPKAGSVTATVASSVAEREKERFSNVDALPITEHSISPAYVPAMAFAAGTAGSSSLLSSLQEGSVTSASSAIMVAKRNLIGFMR